MDRSCRHRSTLVGTHDVCLVASKKQASAAHAGTYEEFASEPIGTDTTSGSSYTGNRISGFIISFRTARVKHTAFDEANDATSASLKLIARHAISTQLG